MVGKYGPEVYIKGGSQGDHQAHKKLEETVKQLCATAGNHSDDCGMSHFRPRLREIEAKLVRSLGTTDSVTTFVKFDRGRSQEALLQTGKALPSAFPLYNSV